jgi:ABC-type spermidine/putrescine transport system permease subunit I
MIWIALSAVLVVVLAALAVLAALIVAYPIAFVLKRIDDCLYFRRARRISAARLGVAQ